jgi:PAS domain S-box-containing protein
MKEDSYRHVEAAKLRRRAGQLLKSRMTAADDQMTPAETRRILYELRVHQIELELQNEELRKSRSAVEEGLERYTDLYDFAPAGYFTLERDGAIRQLNLTAARLLGVERARLVGKRFAPFVSEADRPLFMAFLDQLFETEVKQACEVIVEREGQPSRIVAIEATLNADGQECRAVMSDITERRQAGIAIRDRERQFQILADLVPHLVWNHLPGVGCIYVNLRFCEVTGLTPAQCLGHGWTAAIHHDDKAPTIDHFLACQTSGQEFVAEFRIRTKEGLYRWFLGRAVPYRDETGKIVACLGTAADINEQKRVQTELQSAKEVAEEASRAKSQFLAVLSHELRTPLTPVMAAVTAQLERTDFADELRPTLEMIHRNVSLEARLIDDLLDVMRSVQGKLRLQLTTVDVHELISNAIELCKNDLESVELKLVTDFSAREHQVQGDPARLHQVIWNLLQNASKYTPQGGVITLRTRNVTGDPPGLEIEVADNGQGIAPDLLKRIFDPFEQGNNQMRRRFGGLGLGLSISRSIAEGHGGVLHASSPGLGQGSVFTMTLQSCRCSNSAPPPTPALPAQGPLSILIVEDNADTLRCMASLLRSQGHDVATADSLSEARRLIGQPLDLLLSDIELPDGSGLELMRELAGKVVGIAMSGFSSDEDVRESLDAGFAFHLSKPLTFREINASISKIEVPDRRPRVRTP